MAAIERLEADPSLLAAGGTVSNARPSPARRIRLAAELALLFIAAPLGMDWLVHGEKIPIFVALLPVLVVALILLAADPTFHIRRELARGFGWRTLLSIAAIFVAGGAAATLWITHHHPSWFLEFPTNRPQTYTRIMILYPLFSVAAQELLYRSFYFHRFGPLFGDQRWLGVILNGLLFGFAHIVMESTFAILATAAGGLLLAVRYAMTRSYWAVFLEHTIWGWLVFTIGLGRFFFTGVANP
jgi:membrane protease YdiL (CAAX protease family)